jgi:hypothetical protein
MACPGNLHGIVSRVLVRREVAVVQQEFDAIRFEGRTKVVEEAAPVPSDGALDDGDSYKGPGTVQGSRSLRLRAVPGTVQEL